MRSAFHRDVIKALSGSLLAIAPVAVLGACLDKVLAPPQSAVPSQAEHPAGDPTMSGRAAVAYAALRAESLFASSAVGFGGMPSHQGRALRTLLAETNAPLIFEQLWRDAGPAGRLYALIGLYLTRPEAYARLAPAAATDQTDMTVLFGCIMSRAPVALIAEEIARGELARQFLPDSNMARREAFMDSLAARRSRTPPAT